ncbi:MAG: hypothetical protein GY711_29255, partial [bacterium]|nr:hypothetical protein [bacterium]
MTHLFAGETAIEIEGSRRWMFLADIRKGRSSLSLREVVDHAGGGREITMLRTTAGRVTTIGEGSPGEVRLHYDDAGRIAINRRECRG